MRVEKRILQFLILIGGFVPVLSGGAGMILGPSLFGEVMGPALESHFRYLSALLFGLGLGFWSCIPHIETREPRARVLTTIVFIGGLARLGWALYTEWPPLAMTLAIGMEVLVTPALYFWLRRVSKMDWRSAGK